MRNFKTNIRVLLVVLIAVGIFLGLDFILYPCTFTRNDIHAIATNDYDDLYLGSSHGKMNIDPDVMFEETGRTGHNVSVGGEYPIDAYYMTKLAIEKGHKPSRVVYEVSAGYFTQEKEEGNNYLLFYHEFPLSMAKLNYFKDSLMKRNFRTLLFPWYEYSLSYELKRIPTTFSLKWNKDYSPERFRSSTQEYHESGFIECYPRDEENFPSMNLTVFDEEELLDSNLNYIKKLIDLCKAEGIEFVAVSTPKAKESLVAYADAFEAMDAYFTEFFGECGVPYVNFNGRTYYKLFSHKIENFTDYDGHMNGDAARSFTRVLAQVLEEQ